MSWIAIFFICILFVLIAVVWDKKEQAAFEARFPPISDSEFIARCRPGTDPAVALRVRAIVADCLSIEYERIYPSSRFVEDLGVG
jgi:hypothetical protein